MTITPALILATLPAYRQPAALNDLAKLDPTQAEACEAACKEISGAWFVPPRETDCHHCNGRGERRTVEYANYDYGRKGVTESCEFCGGPTFPHWRYNDDRTRDFRPPDRASFRACREVSKAALYGT